MTIEEAGADRRRFQVVLSEDDERRLLAWAAEHDPRRHMGWATLILHHMRVGLDWADCEEEGEK